MIRLLAYMLIMVIPLITAAQKKTTTLKPLVSADIIYEAAEATISFNKKDFLAAYEQYKKDKADELEMHEVAIDDRVIKNISTSKSKTIIITGPDATPDQMLLEDIIRSKMVGTALLMAGKADVIRKKNNTHEKEIVWGPLIENSDDDTYLFFFTDNTEFFRGSY